MSEVTGKLLWKLYKDKLGADIILIVPGDDREILCHRAVLMGASEYFATRLNGPWTASTADGTLETLTIPDVTFDTLSVIIKCIYTNELEFTDKATVAMAIIAADYLIMSEVLVSLETYVKDNLDHINICETYVLADRLSEDTVKVLKNHMLEGFARGHVPEDIYILDFKSFSETIVKTKATPAHFKSTEHVNGLSRHSNSNIFGQAPQKTALNSSGLTEAKAIRIWAQSNPSERRRYVLPLLASIPYSRELLSVSPRDPSIPKILLTRFFPFKLVK